MTGRGKEFNRTPKTLIHPRKREDNVIEGWRIKKDSEPGPASYNNEPVKNKKTRMILGKEKKVAYMETHITRKKIIPGVGTYKQVEKAVDQ